MNQTKGYLKELQTAIEQYDMETQSKFVAELAYPILESNRLDMKERIDWIVKKSPIDSWPQWDIEEWLKNDREDAKSWLSTQPEWAKKEALMKMYNQ